MTFFRRRKEEQLFRAVETDDDTKARELLRGGGLEWKNPEWHYSTPMHMAARNNAWKCLKELLRAKADVDAPDREGLTVMQLAAQHQADAIVDLLQRRALAHPPEAQLFEFTRDKKVAFVRKLFDKEGVPPPDVDAVHTKIKVTALHVAAERNSLQCLLMLLEKRANPDAIDAFGNTPLHTAVKHSNNEAVAHLLAAKAGVEAANKWQLTPLHMAAEFNNVDAARQLLRVGASREHRNSDGLNALEFARKFKAEEVHSLILNKDSREKERDKLFAVVKSGDIPALRLLIAGGAEMDCVDELTGSTLLHEAAGNHQILCAIELVKFGLKYPVDVRDKKGWTPLHKAAIWNCAEEAEYLLDHDAAVDALDRKFQTPLHLACQHNSADVAFLLLDSKADLTRQNRKGRTPADLARKFKQSDAYKVILQVQGLLPPDGDGD